MEARPDAHPEVHGGLWLGRTVSIRPGEPEQKDVRRCLKWRTQATEFAGTGGKWALLVKAGPVWGEAEIWDPNPCQVEGRQLGILKSNSLSIQ